MTKNIELCMPKLLIGIVYFLFLKMIPFTLLSIPADTLSMRLIYSLTKFSSVFIILSRLCTQCVVRLLFVMFLISRCVSRFFFTCFLSCVCKRESSQNSQVLQYNFLPLFLFYNNIFTSLSSPNT